MALVAAVPVHDRVERRELELKREATAVLQHAVQQPIHRLIPEKGFSMTSDIRQDARVIGILRKAVHANG